MFQYVGQGQQNTGEKAICWSLSNLFSNDALMTNDTEMYLIISIFMYRCVPLTQFSEILTRRNWFGQTIVLSF